MMLFLEHFGPRAAILAALGLSLLPVARAQDADSAAPADSASVESPPSAPSGASPTVVAEGWVSYYGRELAGRRTTSGERFDPTLLTMAHRTLPFGTRVRVTNLHNMRSVVVRVNDRGPFVANRVGDISLGAAHELDMVRAGVISARLELVGTEQPTPGK